MTPHSPAPVTVLVTYHNEGPLLRRCLESVAAQTRVPAEVLIYDDASTEPPAGHIPAGLAVRVLRGETNIGPARARNVLWRESRQEYVHFHDADDEFLPGWGEQIASIIEGHRPDAIFTEITSVTEAGESRDQVLDLARLSRERSLVRFCIGGAILPAAGTYRRALVERLGGYRETLWQSEDWDFHIRLASAMPDYQLVTQPLVRIHVREASRSQKTIEVWESALEAIRLLANELPSGYRDDLAEAAARAGSQLFRAGAAVRARDAFRLARQLGSPVHPTEPRLYAAIARHAGQEWAERIGSFYRRFLPARVRVGLKQGRA